MSTFQLGFWRIVGLLGILVAVLAFLSESRIADNVRRWTDAVLLIGVPLLFFLVAGIGHAALQRLESIESVLRESRGPRS